ncbi:Oxygen-independent coproporphyrinogen-III oxidase [compost metagenome]
MHNPYLVPRDIIAKYNVRGPRYTSYPTAPEWKDSFGDDEAMGVLAENDRERREIPLSLYVHIPFCVKLCYYCGCNKIITQNTEIVERYVEALDREVARVASQLSKDRKVVQIHWGGGTPTHLSPEQIRRVYGSLASRFNLAPDAEISIEVHPTVTTFEHLATLRELGFNRLSMGVQDFDPEVQQAVNRLQTYELTRDLIVEARRLGFVSVNVDLMYGLPLQTVEKFTATLAKIHSLSPDRVALFNYAHLPHQIPGQRLIPEENIPSPDVKLDLFELAIDSFIQAGYRFVGMDHFAKPDNELATALDDRTLRRNFMGYTTMADSDLVSFGVSSISDLDTVYIQNHKDIKQYFAAAEADQVPAQRGMRLTADDRLRRDVINRLICHCYLDKAEISKLHGIDFDATFATELSELLPLAEDGLVVLEDRSLTVTPRGQILLRNICMPFDAYLRRMAPEDRKFSKTV